MPFNRADPKKFDNPLVREASREVATEETSNYIIAGNGRERFMIELKIV